jgi:hypothetical protein
MSRGRTGTKNSCAVYIEPDEGDQDIFVGAAQTAAGAFVVAQALDAYLKVAAPDLGALLLLGTPMPKRGSRI